MKLETVNLESTGFGWLIANGARYDHDLIITTDAQIIPRPKHLSKKYGGWHTVLGPEEIEHALTDNPQILLVGRGHFNQLPILDSTKELLAQRGVQLESASTPQAIARYEERVKDGKRVAVILHLTC